MVNISVVQTGICISLGVHSMDHKDMWYDEHTHTHTFHVYIGYGVGEEERVPRKDTHCTCKRAVLGKCLLSFVLGIKVCTSFFFK